jgi:hypothetical protein
MRKIWIIILLIIAMALAVCYMANIEKRLVKVQTWQEEIEKDWGGGK